MYDLIKINSISGQYGEISTLQRLVKVIDWNEWYSLSFGFKNETSELETLNKFCQWIFLSVCLQILFFLNANLYNKWV